MGRAGRARMLVANAIHEMSSRADKPLVAINCGALPEGILESELFGHVRGAFSGAVQNKRRPVRAGGWRHDLPRRSRRAFPRRCRSSCCASCKSSGSNASVARSPSRSMCGSSARRTRNLRRMMERKGVSARSVLSALRGADHASSFARAPPRHSHAGRALRRADCEPDGACDADAIDRGAGRDDALPMAGQCARATQRDRVCLCEVSCWGLGGRSICRRRSGSPSSAWRRVPDRR